MSRRDHRALTPPRTWRTARLDARPATTADARAMFDAYAADAEVARYMAWRPHRNVGETFEFLRRCERVWAEDSAYPWCLRLADSGELAGMIEIRVGTSSVNLGYVLARRLWRQGLMSEALGWVVDWALSQPEIHRVWATCDIENTASARVLERAGMRLEGILRRWLIHPNLDDKPRDSFCYAVVRD